jgi:hypothetical protein
VFQGDIFIGRLQGSVESRISPLSGLPLSQKPSFLREIRLGIEGRLWVESRPSAARSEFDPVTLTPDLPQQ